ncbi:hypothetical protein BT69DRAFT_1353316 [Atractiella rhizophila]|nr:hypothetical protein BT69DRAFT_1353316 [Atractiella rhizophila]
MGVVSDTLGALLIGTWTNSALWMVEMALLYQYSYIFGTKDHLLIRGSVIICALSDTLCTVINMVGVYVYAISHWGKTEYLSSQRWHIPAYLILTSITTVIVQSYLAYRYFLLSKVYPVTFVLVLLALAGCAACVAVAVGVIQFPAYHDRHHILAVVIVWFATKAATDVSITVALCFHLLRYRRKTVFDATRSLIVRLMVPAIQTGAVTSAVALAAVSIYHLRYGCLTWFSVKRKLVTFVKNPESNTATSLGQNLGRLYTITFLLNLILRDTLKNKTAGDSAKHCDFAMGGMKKSRSFKRAGTQTEAAQGVVIYNDTVVAVDGDRMTTPRPSYPAKYEVDLGDVESTMSKVSLKGRSHGSQSTLPYSS